MQVEFVNLFECESIDLLFADFEFGFKRLVIHVSVCRLLCNLMDLRMMQVTMGGYVLR